MAKNLWDFYDGEPFMENPPLGLLGVNPRKTRKRGSKMAVRRRRNVRHARKNVRHHSRKNSPKRVRVNRRRSTRHRNWLASGMVVPANPRKHHRRRRRNPILLNRHHRRHRRHNPAFLGMQMPAIKTVAFGAIGFAAPPMISGFLTSTFPSMMQSVTSMGLIGKYIVKVGSVLGLTWVVKRFVGPTEANAVMIGGGANIALTVVNDFAPGILPANPLSMYIPTTMAAYVPVNKNSGLRGLRATMPMTVRQIPTAASFPNGNGVSGASKFGGAARRYFRY